MRFFIKAIKVELTSLDVAIYIFKQKNPLCCYIKIFFLQLFMLQNNFVCIMELKNVNASSRKECVHDCDLQQNVHMCCSRYRKLKT